MRSAVYRIHRILNTLYSLELIDWDAAWDARAAWVACNAYDAYDKKLKEWE